MRFIKKPAQIKKLNLGISILKQWQDEDERKARAEKKQPHKAFLAIQPEKFETDRSMKEINFDDVKSAVMKSDESDYCSHSHSSGPKKRRKSNIENDIEKHKQEVLL